MSPLFNPKPGALFFFFRVAPKAAFIMASSVVTKRFESIQSCRILILRTLVLALVRVSRRPMHWYRKTIVQIHQNRSRHPRLNHSFGGLQKLLRDLRPACSYPRRSSASEIRPEPSDVILVKSFAKFGQNIGRNRRFFFLLFFFVRLFVGAQPKDLKSVPFRRRRRKVWYFHQ